MAAASTTSKPYIEPPALRMQPQVMVPANDFGQKIRAAVCEAAVRGQKARQQYDIDAFEMRASTKIRNKAVAEAVAKGNGEKRGRPNKRMSELAEEVGRFVATRPIISRMAWAR